MEVQVVSNEMIKPSSPTPETLRGYKLSFLDQISPRAYSPFIYFYSLNNPNGSHDQSNHNIAEISETLKKSLSQALTLYYPLAGRLIDDHFLGCNDDGALYVEARAKAELSGVIENPIVLELNKLLPFELDEVAEQPLGVQLNVFDCGGVAIGVCFSHRLGDALSTLVFIQSWMAIARGEIDSTVRPELVSGDLFPPIEIGGYDPSFGITKNMCNLNPTKRFVFESPKIESLRTKYQERVSAQKPKRISRVEALSTFIWSRFVAATKPLESHRQEDYTILHLVNIRRRCGPPLPNHSFGNYYTSSTTTGSIASTAEEDYCHGLARKFGEEIRKVDKGLVEYIRSNKDEFLDCIKKATARMAKGEAGVVFVFSSLCRFPLYEADFGFGKPTWVSSASRGFPNAVGFFDDRKGDGIEAYICLKPDDMAKLEADQEFLAFVSPISTN